MRAGLNLSKILVVSCLLAAVGCSAARPNTVEDSLPAHTAVAELVQREGQIIDQFSEAYFAYLLRRLISALPPGGPEFRHLEVVLLAQAPQQAGTPGNGYIILSRPLIASLSNEGQLAFVLAHELGHIVLGHQPSAARSSRASEELELEADSFAVGLIALAGYDPRVATGALTKAAPLGALFGFGATTKPGYPSLSTRLQQVQQMITDSNWQPPGTIDRRDFQLMRRQVMLATPQSTTPLG